MRKSAAAWTSEHRTSERRASENRGSAQVVEFSYVFPLVLLTVVALLYLTFLLFFYVYAFHMTESAVEGVVKDIGGDRVYWQLSSHSLPEGTVKEYGDTLQRKLSAMEVLPGLHFTTSFGENGTGSKVTAKAACTFRGKQVFAVRSERSLRKPTEFAENVDLAEDIAADTGLKDFLQKKFGKYISKDKVYL